MATVSVDNTKLIFLVNMVMTVRFQLIQYALYQEKYIAVKNTSLITNQRNKRLKGSKEYLNTVKWQNVIFSDKYSYILTQENMLNVPWE